MAEYQEVAKMYEKLCKSYDVCYKCPMFRDENGPNACRYWTLVENPKKAEEIIMNWMMENPEKTNGDIFKDTYGFDLEYLFILTDAKGREEWAKHVYKEPKNE